MRLRHFTIALKILIGAGLVYLLVRDAAAEDVWAMLAGTRLSLIALAVLVFAVAVAFNAFRWRVVLDLLGTRLPARTAVIGTFEGMFFNLFLPTGVGGDVARAYRAYDYGLTAKRAAEGALIDRALGLWGLALALAVAAVFSDGLRMIPGWPYLLAFVGLVLVGGMAVAFGAALLPSLTGRKWLDGLLSLVADYAGVVRSRRFLTTIMPMLMASNLAIAVSTWLVAQSIGLTASLADMAVVVEGGALTALIPISIGGWGVREGTIALLMGAMGHPQSAALATSALMGLVLAIIGLAGAAIWIASPYNRTFRFGGRGGAASVSPQDQPDPGASQ